MGLSANYNLILRCRLLRLYHRGADLCLCRFAGGRPALPGDAFGRSLPRPSLWARLCSHGGSYFHHRRSPDIRSGGALNWKRPPVSMPSSDWFPFALLICMNIAMGGLTFWLAGPNDFFIDLDRRSYRHTCGWAFHRKEITGMLDDDSAGVFVRCVSMNSRYDVGLVWKRERQWKRLVMCSRSGRADRCAEETAAALGLLLIAPPPYLKSSSDIGNGFG